MTRGSSGDQLVPVSPGHSQFQHSKFHVLETCQSQENHPSSGPIPRSFDSVGLGWDLRSCLFTRFHARRFENHCELAREWISKEQAEKWKEKRCESCMPFCLAGLPQPFPEEQGSLSGRAGPNTRS